MTRLKMDALSHEDYDRLYHQTCIRAARNRIQVMRDKVARGQGGQYLSTFDPVSTDAGTCMYVCRVGGPTVAENLTGWMEFLRQFRPDDPLLRPET